MSNTQKKIGEIRLNGRAEADGVAFQAYEEQNGQKCIFDYCKATLSEKGEISKQIVRGNINYSNIGTEISKKAAEVCRIAYLTVLILMILSIISIFIPFINHYIFMVPLIAIAAIMLLSEGIVILIAKWRGDEKIKSFLKFLAAMNSCRNAYYKLERMPSIEEAKKHSPISSESRYLRKTYFITYLSFVIAILVMPNIIPTGIALAVLAVSAYLEHKEKMYFWQYMIYSKPEDIHYQVALTALDRCLDEPFEENIMKAFSEDSCLICPKYDFCKSIVDKRSKTDVQ